MPLYEYQCDACGHRFEVIQKYADAPISVCPTCGGAVSKLFSSPAIQFKGSGFYLTDYGRGGGSDTAPGKSDAAGGEKASEGTGGSKTDAAASPSTPASAASTPSAPSETKTEKKADSKPTSPGAASS